MLTILGITGPIFLIVGVGFAAVRDGLLTRAEMRPLGVFVINVALPALLFPAIFLADLQFWLANFGQHLDPKAPLSSSIKPFIPPALGEGHIAQFSTTAVPAIGLWLAILASALILVGLYFHRRAYKPLVEAQLAEA